MQKYRNVFQAVNNLPEKKLYFLWIYTSKKDSKEWINAKGVILFIL